MLNNYSYIINFDVRIQKGKRINMQNFSSLFLMLVL